MSRARVLLVGAVLLGSLVLATPLRAGTIRYDFTAIALSGGEIPASGPGSTLSSTPNLTGYFQYVPENALLLGGDPATLAAYDVGPGSQMFLTNGIEHFSASQTISMRVEGDSEPIPSWILGMGSAGPSPLPGDFALQFFLYAFPGALLDASVPGSELTIDDFHSPALGRVTFFVAPPGLGPADALQVDLDVTWLVGHVVPEPEALATAVAALALAARLLSRRAH